MYCYCVELKGITARLKKKISVQKDFMMGCYEIENNFITQLEKTRKPLSEKYRFGNLEEKYIKIIKKIYFDKDISDFKGKEALEFLERLKKFEGSESKSLFGSFLINYQKTFDNFLK